jgi:hypothetical protein
MEVEVIAAPIIPNLHQAGSLESVKGMLKSKINDAA